MASLCARFFIALSGVTLLHGNAGCSGHERPDYATSDDPLAISNSPTEDEPAAPALIRDDEEESWHDTTCGNTSFELEVERPNFYFVLDASESMAELMPHSRSTTRLDAARDAIMEVLEAVGSRINYGVSVFPAQHGGEGCAPGEEVFALRPGASAAADDEALTALSFTLRRQSPRGATPTTPTLQNVKRLLSGRAQQRNTLFLLTDGAPNCDAAATCDAADCIPNIEAASFEDGSLCGADLNCCSPELFPHLCLDDDESSRVLAELAEQGVETHIVGIPGSEVYAEILNGMARAAGTAKEGPTQYHQVGDAADLARTLLALGESLSRSCSLTVESSPARLDLINVFADGVPLAHNTTDGWSWSDQGQIVLQGQACASWKQGEFGRLNVFEGCPVVVK